MKSEVNFERRDGIDVISYVGPMDEESTLIFDGIPRDLGDDVTINLSQVSGVNSSGVRAWTLFLREFSRGRRVTLEQCSPEIVAQINMIPAFSDGTELRSVIGEVECTECEAVERIELDLRRKLPDIYRDVEHRRCSSCGGIVELEDGTELLLDSIRRHP